MGESLRAFVTLFGLENILLPDVERIKKADVSLPSVCAGLSSGSGFYFIIPLVSIVCGLWVFVFKCKHLLNTLLSLEYIILRIFWFIRLHLSVLGHERYFLLFFLTLAACEGALGLALLVSVVRTHGNDCFRRFTVLQCSSLSFLVFC